MSSQVVGISSGNTPRLCMYKSNGNFKYYNVFSTDSLATKTYSHFPYPWIPDSGFTRPAGGYVVTGTKSPYNAGVLYTVADNVATVSGVEKTTEGNLVSDNMHGCIFTPPQATSRYMWLNPDKIEKNVSFWKTRCTGDGFIHVANPTGDASVVYGQSSTPWRSPKYQFYPNLDGGIYHTKFSMTFFVGMSFTKNSMGGSYLWDNPTAYLYYELNDGVMRGGIADVSVIYSNMPDANTVYKLYRISLPECAGTQYSGGIYFYQPKLQWNITDMPLTDVYTIKVVQFSAICLLDQW